MVAERVGVAADGVGARVGVDDEAGVDVDVEATVDGMPLEEDGSDATFESSLEGPALVFAGSVLPIESEIVEDLFSLLLLLLLLPVLLPASLFVFRAAAVFGAPMLMVFGCAWG